jgi:predicted ribosome quality control (RQC) complex YloA/Tae2 family protein
MSLTQAEIALIVREIEPLCGRSSLQRVLEPAARLLVLQLRQPGATRHLLVSTETDATRLHFLADKPDQPGHPSAFAMLLRKWLHGAALLEVEQVRGDRVVDFTFETVDPRVERPEADDQPPDRIEAHLICELAGRVGNVFLTDGERRIVGRQTDEAIGGRSFGRGEVWTPPPAPPDNGIGEEVRPLLRQADPDDAESAHSRQLERAYRERTEEERRDDLASRIESGLSRTIDRLDRRADHVEEDLEQVEDAGTYKRWAELLQSAYGEVERGDESVQVPDYYQDEMPKVEIPLDPAKSLQENIDHYFHEAHRYEEAREMVEERLLETLDRREEAGEELDAFRRQADEMDLPQLKALAERLRADGLLPKPRALRTPPVPAERTRRRNPTGSFGPPAAVRYWSVGDRAKTTRCLPRSPAAETTGFIPATSRGPTSSSVWRTATNPPRTRISSTRPPWRRTSPRGATTPSSTSPTPGPNTSGRPETYPPARCLWRMIKI